MNLFQAFESALRNESSFKDICKTLKGGYSPLYISGISPVVKCLLALIAGGETSSPVLMICEDEQSAAKAANDLNELLGGEPGAGAYMYPAKDLTLVRADTVSREYDHQRLSVLSAIASGKARVVTASVEAVMQRTVPKSYFAGGLVNIRPGDSLSTEEISRKLTAMGYSRSTVVEAPAQFSVRGSIIDIFPVGETFPVRTELWGDEVDTVSLFDPETQRRTDPVEGVVIPPAAETLYDTDELISRMEKLASSVHSKKAELVRANIQKDIDSLRNGIAPANIDKYAPLCYEEPALIFEYFDSPVVMFSEYRSCQNRAKAVMTQYTEDIKLLLEQGELCRGLEGYVSDFALIVQQAGKYPLIIADTFMRAVDIPLVRTFTVNTVQNSPWGGEIRSLEEDIRSLLSRGYSVAVLAGSEKTVPIIADDLNNDNIPTDTLAGDGVLTAGRVLLTTGALSSGFELPNASVALITQTKALSSKRRSQKRKSGAEEIRTLEDISTGDLVVHSLHGIGRFEGIRKLELDGVTKDYITIKYAGTDVLYVPVTQLDLISRYIGAGEDEGVRLNSLSSGEWQKTRKRVSKAVKDMAAELIKLYAKRAQTPGFAFYPDDDWQHEFEGRFDYVETEDQLKCTSEIKHDMEKPVPMDRLLCGDVGFGKTEVAFRAAFKCMVSGKQCAILVPTTVLAFQHYQSALKRFEHFPFTIELMSRFRSPKEQKAVLKGLEIGSVDMVIGTHRLVQKDVKFHDIGLAIVDEEQRFGVKHKERFKETFAGIDMLTLSATPIPRTLNMAMSGIRDMSVIEEPPIDRYPVQTYVIEFDQGVIIQAIEKELRRGGQVYYIHNRVETIDICAGSLAALLPEARIAVAHGQTDEEELSDIWTKLVQHEIDILVCTTIVETGVDVPNVNTLIIEDSDRFGLSQLYQLRGRVGRSNRRAYAYFTFRRGKVLTEVASKRLSAIREFTSFGSGFRIAMRDLEIRGAGDILGGRQHGHMEAVGYDMYIRLLNRAIAEETGAPPPPSPEDCLIDLQIDAHIPEDYITSLTGRLEAYRRIAAVKSVADSVDLTDEFIDRYGDPPKAIIGLINVALTRNLASRAGVREISQKNNSIVMYVRTAEMQQVQALNEAFRGRVTANFSVEEPYISIALKKESPAEVMQKAVKIFAGE
ncbi:MAG: transcription-repair coupling factor [Oscillospiraceae bacterium]|nr:transcription-repair coupling factor [Oscillospiraceae bacterium]